MAATIATLIDSKIDAAITSYSLATSSAISAALPGAGVIAVSIYIILMGFLLKFGKTTIVEVGRNLFKIALVLMLCGSHYQSWVYNFVSAIPGVFIETTGNASSVPDLIDKVANSFVDLGSTIVHTQSGFSILEKVSILVVSVVVFGCGVVIAGYALITYEIAKVGLAMILGIGPFFVFLLAFPDTKSRFDSWFNQALNFAMQQGLVAVAISLFSSIVLSFVENMKVDIGKLNLFGSTMELVILTITISAIVRWAIPEMASALSGGGGLAMTNEGMGRAMQSAGKSIASGVAAGFQKLAGSRSDSFSGGNQSHASGGGSIAQQSTPQYTRENNPLKSLIEWGHAQQEAAAAKQRGENNEENS